MEDFKNQSGEQIQHEDNRCQHNHQPRNRVDDNHGKLKRILRRQSLGRDLTEDQYEKCQNSGRYANVFASKHICAKSGCKRGSGDIDDVISDQDCA